MNNIYEIRDPIHQFVTYNKLERELINSAPFQRLRRIRQLAFTDLVYPGAVHTRFLHSLGVMHLAGMAHSILERKFRTVLEEKGWTESKRMRAKYILRLASLLHDIGHAPFSHTGEELFPKKPNGGKYRHEEYSRAIILAPPICDIINSYTEKTGVIAEDIANFLSPACSKEYLFWRQLLDSDLDIDRMDYLNRDSHFCGVKYGLIDHNRILSTLTLKDEDDNLVLALEEGGVNATESLIYARYLMFIQVYFHKTRRAYDLLLSEYLPDKLPSGALPGPDDLDSYLKWDDIRVIQCLQDDLETHPAAKAIMTRNHYREVHSTTDYPGGDETTEFYQIHDRLRDDILGGDQSALHFDDASVSPHKFRKASFDVKGDTSGEFIPIQEVSPLIKSVTPIHKLRLYLKKRERLNEVRNFVRRTAGQWRR